MEVNKIYQGDALSVLKTLAGESVNCCITSPPYWGLRDYGVDNQLGLEKTPEEYVSKLVEIFRGVRRILKKEGTLWLNLGDSYVGGGRGNDYCKEGTLNYALQEKGCRIGAPTGRINGYKPKDLVGIPWMVAFALRADGWWLRQDIIWHKPNPMPESVTDRCTKSHEYVFLLSKSQKYYFDYEAIQEEATGYDGRKDTLMKGSAKYSDGEYFAMGNANSLSVDGRERWKFKKGRKFGGNKYGDSDDPKFQTYSGNEYYPKYKNLQDKGQSNHTMHENRADGIPDEMYPIRNKRDVWTVNTSPFKEAHFATFPEELIVDMIKAGCPLGGVILDPFMGAGTIGLVARKLERNYVGMELNPKYIDIAEKRIFDEIGLFL